MPLTATTLTGTTLTGTTPDGAEPHEPAAGVNRPSAPASPSEDATVDLLLVDDTERLPDRAATALEAWLTRREGELAPYLAPGATVVLAGLTEAFADDFRGLPLLVRRHGLGVVLQARRTDARDTLGCREPVEQRTRVPGRGLLVERGRLRRIQVMLPGTA